MLKVSIIVPVYKTELYIKKCLDSIRYQTYLDWECILVDDGSPDRSGLICDEYVQNDSRFKIFHKENEGVSSARNVGLDNMTGDLVMFVDSDDWIEKDCLEKCVLRMQNEQIDILQFGLKRVSSEGFILSRNALDSVFLDVESYIKKGIFNVCVAGSVYRVSVIKNKCIRFVANVKFAEDQIFFYTYLSHVHKVMSIDGCFYNYYSNNQSATRKKQSSIDLLLSIKELYVVSNLKTCFYKRIQEQIQIFLERILINYDLSAEDYNRFFRMYYDPSMKYLSALVVYNVLINLSPRIAYIIFGRIFSIYHS